MTDTVDPTDAGLAIDPDDAHVIAHELTGLVRAAASGAGPLFLGLGIAHLRHGHLHTPDHHRFAALTLAGIVASTVAATCTCGEEHGQNTQVVFKAGTDPDVDDQVDPSEVASATRTAGWLIGAYLRRDFPTIHALLAAVPDDNLNDLFAISFQITINTLRADAARAAQQ